MLLETGQLPLAYLTARTNNLTEMAEFIESEMQENSAYDCMQVIDETEKMIKKSKPLTSLRPILPNMANQLTQWPMVNLRAKEAEHAALMF